MHGPFIISNYLHIHSSEFFHLLGLGDFTLENCTHEEAVNALKKCKEKVTFVVEKAEQTYPSSPTMGSMNPLAQSSFYPPRMGPRSVSEEEFNVPRQVS